MSHELRILVRKDVGFWGDALSLLLYAKNPNNASQMMVAEPLVMRTIEQGEMLPQDFTIGNMKMDGATALMDSLWDAGVRPSRAMPGHDMEIALLKAHIEDLRKLLWNRIGMEAAP